MESRALTSDGSLIFDGYYGSYVYSLTSDDQVMVVEPV